MKNDLCAADRKILCVVILLILTSSQFYLSSVVLSITNTHKPTHTKIPLVSAANLHDEISFLYGRIIFYRGDGGNSGAYACVFVGVVTNPHVSLARYHCYLPSLLTTAIYALPHPYT